MPKPAAQAETTVLTARDEPHFVDIPVREPSGIAYHPQRNTLLAVSDQGSLVEMDLALEVRQRIRLRGDLEGVAVHPTGEAVYIASESAGAVYEYCLSERRVLRTFKIDFASHADFSAGVGRNRGVEGVTVAETAEGGYRLYVVVESHPARLVVLSADVSHGAIMRARRRVVNDPIAEPPMTTVEVAASYDLGLRRMSGATFDPKSRMIVVVSASEGLAVSCSLTGLVHKKLSIPPWKSEGVCFLPGGGALLVQDTGGGWFCPNLLADLTGTDR